MSLDLTLDASRGVRAQELLENEVLLEALNAIEQEVIAQWEACPSRDAEGKELLWQLFKTSKKFRAILNGYVETGKLASQRLQEIDGTKRERLRRALRSI